MPANGYADGGPTIEMVANTPVKDTPGPGLLLLIMFQASIATG